MQPWDVSVRACFRDNAHVRNELPLVSPSSNKEPCNNSAVVGSITPVVNAAVGTRRGCQLTKQRCRQPIVYAEGLQPEPNVVLVYDTTTPSAGKRMSAPVWTRPATYTRYVGVVGCPGHEVAVALMQTIEGAVFKLLRASGANEEPLGEVSYRRTLQHLFRYFNGHVCRESLDRDWVSRDAAFADRIGLFPGMRVLLVEPLEAILTFLGSANNSIKRNSKMVAALCLRFQENKVGMTENDSMPATESPPAGEISGEQLTLASLYRFPSLKQLSRLSEEEYWRLGWGYRSSRMVRAVAQLQEWADSDRLRKLADCEYEEARDALETLVGVGRKVADCICLIGLRHFGAIPVDTHCFQFAQRYSYISKRESTVSKSTHNTVGERLRKIFGATAGWAFMVLFVAEVHPFRVRAQHLRMTYLAARVDDDPSDTPRRKLAF